MTAPFVIPTKLLDAHERMVDALIDGPIGGTITIVYPPTILPCPNCLPDPATGKSANIYKTGGPISFANHMVCPVCEGEGNSSVPHEDVINARIYLDPKTWVKTGVGTPIFEHPGDIVQMIGYMRDCVKVQNAMELVLIKEVTALSTPLRCKREGPPSPWGFRASRYFVQYLRRV